MSIEEFAEKFIKAEEAAFHKGEFDSLEELESPDVCIHLQAPLSDVVGFEGHKQYIMGVREMMPGVQQEWEFLAGDGNVCVLSLKETGKLVVDFPTSSLPAGTTVNIDALFVLRLDNGKVAEAWAKGGSVVS